MASRLRRSRGTSSRRIVSREADRITADGEVVALVRNAAVVQLNNGHTVRATVCGRMQKNRVKVVAGDSVVVELTPYDLTKGRITRRK